MFFQCFWFAVIIVGWPRLHDAFPTHHLLVNAVMAMALWLQCLTAMTKLAKWYTHRQEEQLEERQLDIENILHPDNYRP